MRKGDQEREDGERESHGGKNAECESKLKDVTNNKRLPRTMRKAV